MKNILVAGSSGKLGTAVVHELKQRGYGVRALSRTKTGAQRLSALTDNVHVGDITVPESIQRACEGVDAVISCAGASMDLRNLRDRSTFTQVDLHGNANLLHASKQAGVRKFIYVSVAGARLLPELEYCRAHIGFEEHLASSGIPYTIIQPTGFFYLFGEILGMAKRGAGVVIGSGACRSNPVHEQDVAEACVNALEWNEQTITLGGPEVFSRKEMVLRAFAAAGKKPFIISVPPVIFTMMAAPMRFINPRIHALLLFGAAVSSIDAVVPPRGTRRLDDYYRTLISEEQS
jgi:uncharacterized protein YbjT (DUF2867 family)